MVPPAPPTPLFFPNPPIAEKFAEPSIVLLFQRLLVFTKI